jgi:DNA-binding IscR family transcriptional regulator
VRSRGRGYVFAKPPEEISLLELFELIEGESLFDDCLLKHCECGGMPGNCCFCAKWLSATRKIKELLVETSLAAAAWNHPEHRFNSLPVSLKTINKKRKRKATISKVRVS